MTGHPLTRLLRAAATLVLPTAIITGCATDGGASLYAPAAGAPGSLVQMQAAPLATYTPFVGLAAAQSIVPTEAELQPAAQPTRVNQPLVMPQMPRVQPQSFIFPSPVAFATPVNWRPPLEPVPLASRPQDHFWMIRPVASDSVNWPLGTYRYGSTYFGAMNIHAGIDVDAPPGTPIVAAGPGTVIWAGWGLFSFDSTNEKDPYGIAVAIRHDFGYENQPVFTLYAHMEAHNVGFIGQHVETGDVLGWVGSTGNSTGPHVHFEVRVGRNDYYSTRNPELWIAPYSGWGILTGRLVDVNGRVINNTPIEIYNEQGDWVYTVYTYAERVVRADDSIRENFAISDLPAGRYYLRALVGADIPAPQPSLNPSIDPSPTPLLPHPSDPLEGAAAVPVVTPLPLPTATPVAPPPDGSEQKPITELTGVVDVVSGQTTYVVLRVGETVAVAVDANPVATMTSPAPYKP
ncbi:MAG: M23 family metallopeptidase [Anaerolineales bacterium]|nr:M23 family metallopeptidase [Anaerolineales bacterium]